MDTHAWTRASAHTHRHYILQANCTATIKNRNLYFTLSLADLAPLPAMIPNTKNVTTATVYMNALTECVQEKAQFAYVRCSACGMQRACDAMYGMRAQVRAEIDRQLEKYGAGAAPSSDLNGFVSQARRLLSAAAGQFTQTDSTAGDAKQAEAAGDDEKEDGLADSLRTERMARHIGNGRRRGWFKDTVKAVVKAVVHSHHSHHRHVPTGRSRPQDDGTLSATPYRDAKAATMDAYNAHPIAFTDSSGYKWVYGRKSDGSTIGSTQAHILIVNDWHIIAFRGSETGAFGTKSALLDWYRSTRARPGTHTCTCTCAWFVKDGEPRCGRHYRSQPRRSARGLVEGVHSGGR
jgi:hypothetical protein